MIKPAFAAAIAAVLTVAVPVASSGGEPPAPPEAAADGQAADPAALRAEVRSLERRAAWHARRLGLQAPPRSSAPATPVRHRVLTHVVAYLRAREELPPAARPAAAPDLQANARTSPAGRAYADAVRASRRLGIDAPAAPDAAAPDALARYRDVAGWLARRSERRRPAERNAAAARIATAQVGTPYAWGGSSPGGFDCSGLAAYAYGKVGVSLPHNTNAIWGALPKVPRNRLQPGDMVFFNGLGHMGIYVGGGRFVHAPSSGRHVEVIPLSSRDDYLGAVRAA